MKIKITAIFLFALTFIGCNKWLDVDLANKVPEDKLFSKSEGFIEALAGVYSQMANGTLYGRALTMEFLEVYTQEYSATGNHSYHLKYEYNNAVVESDHASIWNKMYACISGANNILKWLDKNGKVLTPFRQKQIRGEVLAIRAFLHYDLIRMFCPDVKRDPKAKGIPYNKIFGVSLPPQYNVEECVQLVLNDLDEAEKWLSDDPIKTIKPYELTSKNEADQYVARMNIYAVKAMKARLYQMRGDRKNAIKYAKEVIECGQFKLLSFDDIDKGESEKDVLFSSEHIFSLRNIEIPDNAKKIFQSSEIEGGGTTSAPLSIKNSYAIYDGNNNDIRYVEWYQLGGRVIFSKYNKENKDKFFPKMPIIKLSEMYLIASEELYYSNMSESLEYINTLRDHRIRNNSKWEHLTKEFIFNEFIRELMVEGQIWYAYKRLHKALPGDIQPSNEIFVFPMPKKEIEVGNR